MTSSITALVAREHTADLRRSAQREHLTASDSAAAQVPTIELRLANAAEDHVLTRLADLDDASELAGTVLLALIDGQAQAGLSLQDGRIVANPFVRTQEAVELLRMRAALLTDSRASGRRLSRLSAKFALRFGADRIRQHARAGS